ncbi:alpha/beta fold hydrolase [Sinisalibacter lacisalsi]|uniref:Hydrolase n=1 Tax=Sinisalibacter lacisalsi TaxID=1526570 RepID=A0ABQ1QPN4_9RHOB|nr:alpha/beta hydrolase [Sinisalibacter lacisalsi]GGD36709.1 hydrolase [Sinisalibacter lacisalsi]
MPPLATTLAVVTLLAILVVALPWGMELLRRPMNERARGDAPGAFAQLSAGNTHYQWHGPRSTRVLVLVHGVSSPSWVFAGLIRGLLAMRYRVLSYDLYGRGFSDRPRDSQTLEFHARQLGELLDALGVQVPVTLMGYSMGGAIAATFAADEPDRVDRLILLAPAGVSYTPGRLRTMARDGGRLGSWLWGLLGGWQLKRAARADAANPSVIDDLPRRIRREIRRRGYLAAILSSERHALDRSLKAVHREIGAMYIPTLAIWGEKDAVIPVASLGAFAAWNRQARQEVIDGAGHALPHTHPKQVLSAIRDFLREVPE